MAPRIRNPLAVGLLLVALVAVSSCSKSKTTAPITNTVCAQKAQQAKGALEDALYGLINSPTPPDQPSDLNFQPVYQLYQDAIACDAGSADAHLGLAVTGLLSLSSDPQVNAAFDAWKTYLQTNTPFETPATRLKPLGVPLTFTSSREAFHLPFDLIPLSTLAVARSSMIGVDPQLDDIQEILETRVLPKLEQARASLSIAAMNPSYTFIVTPRMQGDDGATPVEIDRTDILALRSACSLLEAACNIAVAYEYGFASFDSAGLYLALQPGSGWLALSEHGDGALHLSKAGAVTLGAIDDLQAAITSLLGEADSQDDDVIKIDPRGVTRAEAESLRVYLPLVKQALQTGYTRIDDWDSNPATPDVSLTIRPGTLFANPVPDWKGLLPSYTASVIRRPGRMQYQYETGSMDLNVDIPAENYYSAGDYINVSGGQETESFYGDEVLRTAVTQVVRDRLNAVKAQPLWAGYFSGSASFSGNLSAGQQTISVPYTSLYTVLTTYQFVPVITWEADSFDQWQWPDPTLHGLLPQMTSTSQLLETFGISANQWNKQVVLQWFGTLGASHASVH
jgi:hypothetical protein